MIFLSSKLFFMKNVLLTAFFLIGIAATQISAQSCCMSGTACAKKATSQAKVTASNVATTVKTEKMATCLPGCPPEKCLTTSALRKPTGSAVVSVAANPAVVANKK